jgi:hypothetical protein
MSVHAPRNPPLSTPRWHMGLVIWALLAFLTAVTGCNPNPMFNRPNIIAAAPDGSFLVLNDSQARRLLVIDRDFRLIREITHPHLFNVWGLHVTPTEIIASNHRSLGPGRTREERDALAVIEFLFFDHHGRLLRSWTRQGRGGALKAAGAFHRDADGSIIIVDSRQNCLVTFDLEGREAGFIATGGRDLGQLWYPNDVTRTTDGNLLVVDTFNSRLQLFDPAGKFLRVVVEKGTNPGRLDYPQFMTLDEQGNIYCTELGTMRISMFDPEFRFLRTLTPPRERESDLIQLFGICRLASPSRIVAVDSLNNKLFVFDDQGRFVEAIAAVRQN